MVWGDLSIHLVTWSINTFVKVFNQTNCSVFGVKLAITINMNHLFEIIILFNLLILTNIQTDASIHIGKN